MEVPLVQTIVIVELVYVKVCVLMFSLFQSELQDTQLPDEDQPSAQSSKAKRKNDKMQGKHDYIYFIPKVGSIRNPIAKNIRGSTFLCIQ